MISWFQFLRQWDFVCCTVLFKIFISWARCLIAVLAFSTTSWRADLMISVKLPNVDEHVTVAWQQLLTVSSNFLNIRMTVEALGTLFTICVLRQLHCHHFCNTAECLNDYNTLLCRITICLSNSCLPLKQILCWRLHDFLLAQWMQITAVRDRDEWWASHQVKCWSVH